MLQTIRDKTTGWIATAIMALLIIPFAFWGINYYFTGGSEPVVATVNGTDIKLSEFQRTFTNYRQQMQTIMGSLQPGDDEILKQQALHRLIESELLNQAVRDARLTASDDLVRETIKNIDVFKEEGGFSKEFYQRAVSMLGMPPALYEEQMRLDMMSEQLQSALVESEFASDNETGYAARLANQQRDITYAIIPAERFGESIQVTDEQIEKFYKENRTLYIEPEKVRIAYIQLSLDRLAADMEVNEEDLRAYYDANKADYDVDEQRQVTQILIKTEEGSSEEKKEAARAEANMILEQLRSGKTFADIVKSYADNKDENFSISEHGFLGKGILEDEVDEVVFTMNKGDISDVIQSKLGFHIVELKDIKGGVMNTFENSREEVEKDYRHKQAEQRYFDLADQLANSTYEHPDTLEIAAAETGLQIQESELFSRSGGQEGLVANTRVIDASFSEDVMMNGHNSEVLEISDSELMVLRVLERMPEARRPLEEVRDKIINDIKFSIAGKQAYELGQQVIADLNAGKDFNLIAQEKEVEWQEAAGLKRSDVSVNRAVLRTAFRLGQPQENMPVTGGISLGTGDYAIVAVLAVNDPDPGSIKDIEIKNTKTQLQATRAAASWKQFMNEMKSASETLIFQDRIQ